MKPGLEAVGISQAGEPLPGGDERLLGGVLGPPVIPQDQPRDDVEPADRDARELTERAVVACDRLLDEIPLHRGSTWGAVWVVALQPMSPLQRFGSGFDCEVVGARSLLGDEDQLVAGGLGAPDLAGAAEQLADGGGLARQLDGSNRSVDGSKRTMAFAPKSVSQTMSRSST